MLKSDISQANSQFSKNKILDNILNDLNIKGEITNANHPLVDFVKDYADSMENSRIKDSYIKNSKWKEYKKDKEIYLLRIVKKINNNAKSLIKNEFKIHQENPDLIECSLEFVCYYFSKFLNFSLFKFKEYYTLEEILEKKVVKDFSKKALLSSVLETINNIQFQDKYYICPFLTPSNLLYTESVGKEYFFITELFLVSDSIDKEIEVELNVSSEWLVSEFQSPKSTITFYSNICCVGYLFYKILYGENPFKDEDERIKKKIPDFKDSYQYKKLIENCIKIEYKERWSLDDIQDYIDKNIYEEKEHLKKELYGGVIDDNSPGKKNENSIENKEGEEKKDIEENQKEIDNKIKLSQIVEEEKSKTEIKENLEKSENELSEKGSNKKENEERDSESQEDIKKEKEGKEKEEELRKKNEENQKIEKELFEIKKKFEEKHKKEKEEEEKKLKEIEERKQKEIEEKKQKEKEIKEEKEKEEKNKLELQEVIEKQKQLKEEIEKIKKEEEEKERLKKEELERIEKEEKEKERIEKEKKEAERIGKEKKEKERIQKEKEEKERIRIEREKMEKLQKELLERENKRKEKEEKERKEKERIEKEEKHANKFPKGITSSPRENDLKNEINFIHLDIIFKSIEKQVEIFDIFAPKKKGYQIINFEGNIFFTVFPFY